MLAEKIGKLDLALTDIREALRADGYDLAVRPGEGERVAIEVSAGPDACVECLIPKDVFEQLVESACADSGYGIDRDAISIIYPTEGSLG